jgi:type I restriction enzyme S subunit
VTGIRDGQNINYSKLSRSDLPVPPPAEQRRIAHFLDTYTARTDRLIRAKERLIELLEEQKQAIIQRAVTRGLNPDVAMKDSGVSWFNEIPEGWEVLSVRRLSNFITSGSRGWSQYYSDTGDLFIQSGNLDRLMTFDFSSVQHVQPPSGAEGKRTKVQRNDILICITGALTGNTVLVDVDLPTAYVNQHVALVRPKKEMVAPRFLAYCLHSQAGKQQFKMNEYGGTKKGLGLDDVKSTVVPVPSRAIQREIVTFLDERLATLKETVDATQREITLIREYRTRLIADVVTGKLDVREAEAAHAAAEPSAHAPANQDAHLSPSAA